MNGNGQMSSKRYQYFKYDYVSQIDDTEDAEHDRFGEGNHMVSNYNI